MVLKLHWNILMTMLFCHSVKASENISVNKTSNQSTSWEANPSSLAVDGNKDCSNKYTHTNEHEESAWWQVNLGDVYEIKKINIYYRTTSYTHRLNGYSIEIALNDLSYQDAWQCYKDLDISQLPSSTPSHICRGLGQYVKLFVERLPNLTYRNYDGKGAVINLCEFEVFGCLEGHYGNGNCNSYCSVGCINSRCDPDNGHCNCTIGWTGDKCDHVQCNNGSYLLDGRCASCPMGCVNNDCKVGTGECTKGCKSSYYGTFCNLTCTQNCYNTSCARFTGQCIGCKVGLHGDKCDKICSRNCKDKVCKQDDGYCTNCNYPYTGTTCTDCNTESYLLGAICIPCSMGCVNKNCNENGECLDGCNQSLYGIFCNLTCPTNCYTTSCSRNSGKCTGCTVGSHGDKCDATCPSNCKNNVCRQDNGYCANCNDAYKGNTCTDCLDGKFGENCDQECPSNCNSTKCSGMDGSCMSGCKYKNMIGRRCEECSARFYGATCNFTCSENCTKCNRNTGDCLTCISGMTLGPKGKCSIFGSDNTGNKASQIQTNNTGLIVGGIVAVIVVIVIAVVIMLLLRRRRRNSGKEIGYENQIIFSLPKPNHELKDTQKKKSNNTDTVKESVVSIENGNEYCNSSEVYMNLTLTDVPISELSSIISIKAAGKEFESEYEKLPKGSKHPTTVGKHPNNKIKNRFLTTFPYDHSRVVLKPISTQQKSDYINANYIDGAETRRAYIATQGPKENTLFDFWKMVWQEKSEKIVMLTNLIENEKPKCEQYWPDIGQEKDFGPLKVTMESEKEYAFFVERSLQLTNKKTKETRQILQFHFTMWPDHGTPDPVQLMLFHRKVKEVKATLTGPPIIHCAAGIGRTGTFIALDTLHDYGDKTGRIDIFEYVIRMRKDRMNMIQTLEQYVVLHESLLESFQYTGRSLSRNKFLEVCNEQNEAKPKNQTHVYKEFQNLSALRPVYGIESYDSALDKDNRRKSRNQNILAVEKYRPFLMSQHSSRTNFINAVMLPTFRKKCGYFVTHYPLDNTVVDLWCLVFDHDSSTVVVLDEISEKDNVVRWYPDDETEMTVDSFQIKKVSGPHIYGRVREVEFTVTHQDDEKSVRMLMIRPWAAGRCVPPDKNDLLKLIEMKMTRQTTNSGPVTIVCSDGARCCGLFCTVSNVILNLRIEDEIDIFHTVRQLQIRRPQFITDYEEYKSCYEIVKLFLESSNIYANV